MSEASRRLIESAKETAARLSAGHYPPVWTARGGIIHVLRFECGTPVPVHEICPTCNPPKDTPK